MKVNFNNLRAQAAYALDNLTRELNAGILKQPEHVLEIGENGNNKWIKGNVLIDADDIRQYMKELRSLILTINAVYEPNDEEFKDMSQDIEDNGGVAKFNIE